MKLDLPYLTYSDVKEKAQNFLLQWHPSLEPPIPIEEIIDVYLGIDIFPLPRLYKDFRLNGFLSKDRTTIIVDQFQYERYNEKYRFTLAHELGHYLLHESCYENISFSSPQEYLQWKTSLASDDIDWFETHGDWFAELVLVPTEPLERVCSAIANKYRNKLPERIRNSDDFWSYASNEIAKVFEVNPPVIEIRLKREKVPERYNIN